VRTALRATWPGQLPKRHSFASSLTCRGSPHQRPGQALRVEVRDLFLVSSVDGHLIKELASGFHAAVWSVRGEEDAVDTDRVRQAQIGLVRQIPVLSIAPGAWS
jgi:hypothetical protein